jgi:hypothetical protein
MELGPTLRTSQDENQSYRDDGNLPDSSGLDDDPEYENAGGNQDAVFPRRRLGHEATQQRPQPRTQFENRRQPPLPPLISRIERVVITHICPFSQYHFPSPPHQRG